MLATGAGLSLWARQYQQGRPLWQLAVVMGLAATTFSQGLPDALTRHVQVGPGYVRTRAVAVLVAGTSATRAPASGETTADAAYLGRLYRQIFARPVSPDELARWDVLLRRARHCTWAYMVLTSREYAARAAKGTVPTPPDPVPALGTVAGGLARTPDRPGRHNTIDRHGHPRFGRSGRDLPARTVSPLAGTRGLQPGDRRLESTVVYDPAPAPGRSAAHLAGSPRRYAGHRTGRHRAGVAQLIGSRGGQGSCGAALPAVVRSSARRRICPARATAQPSTK